MPTVHVTMRNGEERSIEAGTDRSLMQNIRDAGIDEVQALCGGCAACCTCHVYVDEARLASLLPISEQEDALLESSDARRPTSRLSCQIPVTDELDGVRVTVAPEM